jgi:fluoride exporter
MMLALAVAVAGGLGAVARFVLDGWVAARSRGRVPRGTLLINLTGSFALGLLTGWVSAGAPPEVVTIAGTGFLGGYTTFSTASLDTARLLRERQWWAAVLNGLGMLVAALLLAAAGFAVGRLIATP